MNGLDEAFFFAKVPPSFGQVVSFVVCCLWLSPRPFLRRREWKTFSLLLYEKDGGEEAFLEHVPSRT